jgi:hypothetical protein
MVLSGEFMGKQPEEEQDESLEEDMRAFFDSAVFEPKPKRKRKSRGRNYRRGRKGKKAAKEDKEIPASVGEDLGAFFDNDIPEAQEESKANEKEDKEDIEENLRGFFREGVFEDQIGQADEEPAQSFMCPHCGNRLGMSTDECECGATFVEEDKKVEAEITEFLDELALDEEEDMEVEELEDKGLEPEEEPEAVVEAEVLEEEEVEATLTVTPERLRRDRICFYVGSVLLLLGGPVLIFSSFLHDWFMVPLVGTTYDAFGWINVTYAILILIIGIILFAISLRGGIITNKELKKLRAKSRDA